MARLLDFSASGAEQTSSAMTIPGSAAGYSITVSTSVARTAEVQQLQDDGATWDTIHSESLTGGTPVLLIDEGGGGRVIRLRIPAGSSGDGHAEIRTKWS